MSLFCVDSTGEAKFIRCFFNRSQKIESLEKHFTCFTVCKPRGIDLNQTDLLHGFCSGLLLKNRMYRIGEIVLSNGWKEFWRRDFSEARFRILIR